MKPLRRSPAPAREPLLPFINVAVLLLVFLAVFARIEAADPLAVALPAASGTAIADGARLFVGAEGHLASDEAQGEAALAGLAARGGPVQVFADAALPAPRLVELLNRLAGAGLDEVSLMVLQP